MSRGLFDAMSKCIKRWWTCYLRTYGEFKYIVNFRGWQKQNRMVYMHFPYNLTEEEELLQKKYAKLRKKKKALAALKAPKPEPKEEKKEELKRKVETASNATEQAKKLLKAGAIKVATERKDSQTFKRTKRQKGDDKSTVVFQPFSGTNPEEDASGPSTPSTPKERTPRPMKSLYDSFVSRGRDRDDRPRYRDREREVEPKKGNTIYVFGPGLTEAIVKKTFANLGTIINTSMEQEKNCAFITFERMEHADEAIAQMNGSMVQGVQLSVSMARRQPTFEPTQSDAQGSTWSSIAASQSQKGNHQDKRNLVAYDNEEDDLFS